MPCFQVLLLPPNGLKPLGEGCGLMLASLALWFITNRLEKGVFPALSLSPWGCIKQVDFVKPKAKGQGNEKQHKI